MNLLIAKKWLIGSLHNIILLYVLRTISGFVLYVSIKSYGPLARPEIRLVLRPGQIKVTHSPQNIIYYVYYMLVLGHFS